MQPNWQNYSIAPAVEGLVGSDTFSLIDMSESFIAGASAAVVATVVLGVAKLIHRWWLRRGDVGYLREIITEGRMLVFKDDEVYHEAPDARSPADVLRAAQYNNMISRLRAALGQWTVNLSHSQRRDIFDALDWFHTKGLHALVRDGQMQYVQIPDGNWPTVQMSLGAAEEIFARVESIKWLKLTPR